MAINIIQGYNPSMPEPIDSRFSVSGSVDRLGFDSFNVYEGLVVYQRDNNTLYVLVDTASYNSESGWKTVGSDTGGIQFILSGSNSATYISASSNNIQTYINSTLTQTNTSSSVTFGVPVSASIFSGSFVGNGANLTGIVATVYNPNSAISDIDSNTRFFISHSAAGQYITYSNLLTELTNATDSNLEVDGTTDGIKLKSQISVTGVSASFTGSLTGNLIGTASWASNVTGSIFTSDNPALSASFATTSSFSISSSFATTASFTTSASYSLSSSFATSASFSTSSSFATSASFATTSSFSATASYVNGDIFTSANPALSASFAVTSSFAVSSSFTSRSAVADTIIANGSLAGLNMPILTDSSINPGSSGAKTVFHIQAVTFNSSTKVLSGVTSSWAQSASNAINSQTASFLTAGTYLVTASWATNALSASNVINAFAAGTNVDNQVITATGAGTLNGESNLTFDGNTLGVTGNINSSGPITGSALRLNSLLTGVDNTVLVLDSSNNVVTDEIDSRVWGSTLISGSGTANQIAYFNASTGITGQAGFTFNPGTNLFTAPNVLISGDLTVIGTASFQETTNLTVADRFILLASGSNSDGDGGIIVQQTTSGQGEAFGFDAATSRWAVTSSYNGTMIQAFEPDAWMSTVYFKSGVSSTTSVPGRFSANGNIFIGSDENIWIYS